MTYNKFLFKTKYKINKAAHYKCSNKLTEQTFYILSSAYWLLQEEVLISNRTSRDIEKQADYLLNKELNDLFEKSAPNDY